jgi:hypothetical protein
LRPYTVAGVPLRGLCFLGDAFRTLAVLGGRFRHIGGLRWLFGLFFGLISSGRWLMLLVNLEIFLVFIFFELFIVIDLLFFYLLLLLWRRYCLRLLDFRRLLLDS